MRRIIRHKPSNDPLFILAFGAHADDTDIGCSGTLALHARNGIRVGVCDITHAELSSNGTIHTRIEEAGMAADQIGLHVRLMLGMPDRSLTRTEEAITELVEVIRLYRPTFVLAPDFEDRHPDHRHCAELVEEAVFSAALRRYGTPSGLPPHRVKQILYYYINGISAPEIAVDIAEVAEVKSAALAAYGTQFDPSKGSATTPLNQGFLDAIRGRDALIGHQCGRLAAEGFRTRKPIIVQSLSQLE